MTHDWIIEVKRCLVINLFEVQYVTIINIAGKWLRTKTWFVLLYAINAEPTPQPLQEAYAVVSIPTCIGLPVSLCNHATKTLVGGEISRPLC